MKLWREFSGLLIACLFIGASCRAQSFSARASLREALAANSRQTTRSASTAALPQTFRDFVVDGKLRLSLQDAVFLTLANNSNVRINQLPVETAKNAIERAFQSFDPVATSSFNAQRSTSPLSNVVVEGVPTLSSLNQQSSVGYSQLFGTGTRLDASFGATRLSSNSTRNLLNPSVSTSLQLRLMQPLLRGFGLFPNGAPIVIARRSLEQSRASFAVQVNDTILQAVNQYWNVVHTRENLELQRKSLEQAEASYQRDKRALELGALSPLDIYRSESQVASRRLSVLQAEYALKQAQDQLRFTLGANQDPYVGALDLDLTEQPEPAGELLTMDAAKALEQALVRRPELEALRQAAANDETSIRLARNTLLPDLRLNGTYSTSGLAGNRVGVQQGLTDSLGQVFNASFPTYSVGLTLNLPIRNRAAQASLGDALVSRDKNTFSDRLTREQIKLEVSSAVHNLESAKLSMAAAKDAVDLAQKNLAAEQRKYELGTQTIFFVLEAQTELAQAELSLVQEQIAYQNSMAAIDHATASLADRYHIAISDLSR